MLTQIQEPDRHFSAFYQDNAILIQFMIEEFIRSCQLTFQIKSLIQEGLESIQNLNVVSSALTHTLGELIGSPVSQESSSRSLWTKGSLTKFKEYCEQFSHNSGHRNKRDVNLHIAAQKTWGLAVNNYELVRSFKVSPYPQNSSSQLFYTRLERTLQRFQNRFNQIIRSIPRLAAVYGENENFILYLYSRKNALEEIYGSDVISSHFKISMKTPELLEWMLKKYQARGFEDLSPTIQYLMETKEMAASIS